MIKYHKIVRENLEFAVKIQRKIFPSYSARQNYLESITCVTDNKYYLVYDDDVCIGITGAYNNSVDPNSIWLGWFGVLSQYRRRGYGKTIFEDFVRFADMQNFNYVRLYTERDDNEVAISFYKKLGLICEPYINDNDADKSIPLLIFSKSLNSQKFEFWNDRNIGFKEQLQKQTP